MNQTHKLMHLAFMAVTVILAGCERRPEHSSGSPSEFPTNVTSYQVKGVLKEIRAAGWKALIAHEDIPGYMEAMTMQLDVRDTNELRNLQPGDQIAFRMLVTDTDGWIDQVRKTGVSAPPSSTITPVTSLVEELEVGAPVPDCILTNQLGQDLRLSDFKGRALAFTFIFTRCPFPTFCPRMNNNLGSVQRRLMEATTRTNWHLISISFDPEFDTPARLAAYAQGYQYDPAHWSFATGKSEDIRKLGGAFGLAFWREGALFNHNVRTVVVDAAGRVQKIFADNEWKPDELAKEMQKAMEAKP
ncbi:MAG: hypothetical protein ABS95_03010 [Verrucomicrobia bacterium SCN 57-15]|nr:MAG: hypothetical protein ABS95_03010 [Verrucomicrobia bacterium SCN 57-15]